jgi:hypothetical protein
MGPPSPGFPLEEVLPLEDEEDDPAVEVSVAPGGFDAPSLPQAARRTVAAMKRLALMGARIPGSRDPRQRGPKMRPQGAMSKTA